VGALRLAYAPRRALSGYARLGGTGGAEAAQKRGRARRRRERGANHGSGRGIARPGGKVSVAWRARRLWRESVWGGDKRTSRRPTAQRPRVRAH
jgi:hypothetical protein